MPEYITREEHEAVISRIDAEDARQNQRIEKLEEAVENIAKLTVSVEKLAVNMDKMAKEQEKMTTRISKLEAEPGENWHKAVRAVLNMVLIHLVILLYVIWWIAEVILYLTGYCPVIRLLR